LEQHQEIGEHEHLHAEEVQWRSRVGAVVSEVPLRMVLENLTVRGTDKKVMEKVLACGRAMEDRGTAAGISTS